MEGTFTSPYLRILLGDENTVVLYKQCMGSGIRMFLGLPDPGPLVRVQIGLRIRIRLRILPFSRKCVERTEMIHTYMGYMVIGVEGLR